MQISKQQKRRIRLLPAIALLSSFGAYAENFVAPASGTLYISCVGGSAGAVSQFGTGTSIANFVPYLNSLPGSCPTAEVSIGAVTAGQTVPFGIHTVWEDQDYWAFSSGTNEASIVAFGGNNIQQTSSNTWVMHLNDAAHYTISQNEANNILIQLRLAAPTGDMNFTMPATGNLYLETVTAKLGASWTFGVGTTPANCVIALASLPDTSPPSGEVSIGTYQAGEDVKFCMWTQYGTNQAWAFSDGTDAASIIAFWDTEDQLGMGGRIIQQTSPTTWIMHLDNAVSYLYDDSNNDILMQIRLASVSPSQPSISAVVNAASYQAGMSPGMLATLFGTNLSPVVGVESAGGATSYKGVSISVDNLLVPLFTVANVNGAEQINFQVPAELTAPGTMQVQINNNGSIGTVNVPITAVQPGIFEYVPAGTALSYAAIMKPDGSVVGPSNPATRGSTVVMFLTGLGPTSPFLATGQPGPVPPATTIYQPVVVGLNSGAVPAVFSGAAPYFIGLDQVNFQIPANASVGSNITFSVSVNGVFSQPARIAVQ